MNKVKAFFEKLCYAIFFCVIIYCIFDKNTSVGGQILLIIVLFIKPILNCYFAFQDIWEDNKQKQVKYCYDEIDKTNQYIQTFEEQLSTEKDSSQISYILRSIELNKEYVDIQQKILESLQKKQFYRC